MSHRGHPVDNNVLTLDISSCKLLGNDDLLGSCSHDIFHMGAARLVERSKA